MATATIADRMDLLYGHIRVKIQGLTPLLMNRLDIESLTKKARNVGKEYNIEDDAHKSAYIVEIDGKEQLYVPCEALYSMIIAASARYKADRTPMSRILAGGMHIEPEKVLLGTDKYEIDVRAVRIMNARVPHARARLDKWELEFTIVYDKTLFTKSVWEVLQEIVETAGRRYGLLDYRPQHKGWFGTFIVKEFTVVD